MSTSNQNRHAPIGTGQELHLEHTEIRSVMFGGLWEVLVRVHQEVGERDGPGRLEV